MTVVEYNTATSTTLFSNGGSSWVIRSRNIERRLPSASISEALEEFDSVVVMQYAAMRAAA